MPGAAMTFEAAVYTPSDGQAEPQKAVPAIARAAQRGGATILTRCAVRGLDRAGGRVTGVVTERGRIACGAVVLAGGAWSRLFCGNQDIELPQLDIRSGALRTGPIPGGPEIAAICERVAFRKRLDGGYTIANFLMQAEIVPDSFRLARQFLPRLREEGPNLKLRLTQHFVAKLRTKRRWALDVVSPFEKTRVLDPPPIEADSDAARSRLAELFPVFREAKVVQHWGGMIDVTPDAIPVISAVDSLPGFFVATGFSGHGFGIGPGAGSLMADLVTGAPPIVDPNSVPLRSLRRGNSMTDPDWSLSALSTPVPFDVDGRHFGDLRLRYSDNRYAAGYIPIPIAVVRNGAGPTLLLTGGTHGDEYEGSAAILRLVHDQDIARLRGRIIALPALNSPAFFASARVSPIDGVNLNRAFPGDRAGTPTYAIAQFVEQVLMPISDAVIDLHSGGKASFYMPSVLATRAQDLALFRSNLELARVFAAPLLWVLGSGNDARSMNSAAARQGVPMVATELGGNGTVTPAALAVGNRGVRNIMIHLGMIDGVIEAGSPCPAIETTSDATSIYAPTSGVFEPCFEPGETIRAGAPAGRLYPLPDIERPPIELAFPADGIVLARISRGFVERGEKLAFVGQDARLGDIWR